MKSLLKIKMTFLSLVLPMGLAAGMIFPAVAFAVTDYAEVAREKQYVGGPDESELKVQQTVKTTPKVKTPEEIEASEGY